MTQPFHYWKHSTEPPPEPSKGLLKWAAKAKSGWRPNKRLRMMGYESACDYYKVYVWEWQNVLWPMFREGSP